MSIRNIFDKVPVNKTAGRVVGKGFDYEPDKVVQTADSETPLPTSKSKKCDLLGARCGRLTVLGYAQHVNKRLVVRCVCGIYTLRTAKAIKNKANYGDRCERCKHVAYLKKKDIWKRTGRDVDVRDM